MNTEPVRVATLQSALKVSAAFLEVEASGHRENANQNDLRICNQSTEDARETFRIAARADRAKAESCDRQAVLIRALVAAPVAELDTLHMLQTQHGLTRAALSDGIDSVESIVAVWESGDLAGAVNAAEGWADLTRKAFGLMAES